METNVGPQLASPSRHHSVSSMHRHGNNTLSLCTRHTHLAQGASHLRSRRLKLMGTIRGFMRHGEVVNSQVTNMSRYTDQ